MFSREGSKGTGTPGLPIRRGAVFRSLKASSTTDDNTGDSDYRYLALVGFSRKNYRNVPYVLTIPLLHHFPCSVDDLVRVGQHGVFEGRLKGDRDAWVTDTARGRL